MRQRGDERIEHGLDLAADQIDLRWRRSAVGNVRHADAGHAHEQLAGQVRGRASAKRGHADLAWVGFGVGDELRDRFHRQLRIHVQCEGEGRQTRNRGKIMQEIERQRLIERRINRVRCGN